MRKLIQAAAAVLIVLSTNAMAQVYVGGAIGSAKIDDSCEGTDSCSLTSTGGKVFGGYRLNNNLALEANYFNFGTAKATAGAVSADLKTTALGLGVALFGDFSPNWRGVMRIGVASVKEDVTGSLQGLNSSLSETNSKVYVGFGIGYLLSKNVSIDAAADFSSAAFEGSTDNVRLFSVGVTFSF